MNWQQERIKELETKVSGLEKVNKELMRRLLYAESKIETNDFKLVGVNRILTV